jgi:hypothetical protein
MNSFIVRAARWTTWTLAAALVAATLTAGDVSAQASSLDRGLAERGRSLTGLMYTGDLQPIWDRSSPSLQETLQSIDSIRDVHEQLLESLGAEATLLEERTVRQDDLDIYVRTVTFERTADSRFFVQWAFDRKGAIQGFTIRPAQ